MNVLGNRLVVRFDENHKRLIPIGDTGVMLLRPDEWVHKNGDKETHTSTEENTNYLETKPQICVVTHENKNHPYKVSDRLFVHYMAWVTAEYANESTKEAYIDADYVFCTMLPDGGYKMANHVYFGEQLFTDDEITPNGIIINVLGHKPKLCQIRLVHLHSKSEFEVGDTILTIDNNQYPAVIDGHNYVMVRDREIVGKLIEEYEKEC